MEKLFTEQELKAIEYEAKSNLTDYLATMVITGDSIATTIITISEYRHLIFVEGNEDTAYSHISDRHSMFSHKNYWVKVDDDNYRLDDPSKFHPTMMPIIDFVKIAEAIFTTDNKNITKNNHPDKFDKYTGAYAFKDGPEERYHLLTYKDTRIVHTLFPDKKRHNRKSKVKLGKGIVTTTTKFPAGYNDLVVPYENNKGLTAYSILIRKYYQEKVERTFIQKHDELGEPEDAFLVYEREFKGYERFEWQDMNTYQNSDLTDYERLINQIDEQYKAGIWTDEELVKR
jgi:hypothetical protein